MAEEEPDGIRQRIRHQEAASNEAKLSRQHSGSGKGSRKKRGCSRQASAKSNDSTSSTCTRFIMIPKSFNEEVTLTNYGPKQEVSYNSACSYDSRQYFKTSVQYEHCYTPKHFESTLIVTPATEEYLYRERVELVPKLRARSYSESITTYPKKLERTFKTTLTHWDNYRERRYVTGVELVPAERLRSVKDFTPEVLNYSAREEGVVNGHSEPAQKSVPGCSGE